MEGTKLFAAFKKAYDTPEKAHDISVEMRGSAERFAALYSSKDPIWSDYSDDARRSAAIEKRQGYMAELATAIWRFQ